MQVEEENMRDEYPAPDEVKKEGDMEETVQREEIDRDDEEINLAMDEEHFDEISEYLEDDAFPDADVYIGKQVCSSLDFFFWASLEDSKIAPTTVRNFVACH